MLTTLSHLLFSLSTIPKPFRLSLPFIFSLLRFPSHPPPLTPVKLSLPPIFSLLHFPLIMPPLTLVLDFSHHWFLLLRLYLSHGSPIIFFLSFFELARSENQTLFKKKKKNSETSTTQT
jgi:hypothetical protein